MVLLAIADSLSDEGHEEWARVQYRTLILGVELYPHVPAMAGDLYRLYETRIGVLTGTDHTCTLVVLAVLAVELEAMPVALPDEVLAVGLGDT